MIGGLATSVLLFQLALLCTARPWFGFVTGMSLQPQPSAALSRIRDPFRKHSTLTVVAVVVATVSTCRRIREGRPYLPMLLTAGLLSGAAILVRPQFIFLLVLLPMAIGIASWKPGIAHRRVLADAALAAAPPLIVIFAWSSFVFGKTGFFALSTQSGLGLVNHSVAFVELAPERYATTRDILLRYREIKLAEQGHYGNTGWLALPEIRRVTGMSLPETSRELQRMSVELFIAHPIRYARTVVSSWIDFWAVPIVWEPERISPSALAPPLQAVWWVEHKLLRLANLVFFVLVCSVLLSRRARNLMRWDLDMTIVSALILFSSVLQALADYGAGSRYAVTVQTLVIAVVTTTWLRTRAR